MIASVLGGCADEAPPAQTPATVSPRAPVMSPSQAAELLASLSVDNLRIKDAATAIAALGDEGTRRDAATRLATLAQTVMSAGFREAMRARLQASTPPGTAPALLEAKLDGERDGILARIIEAMHALGGPAVVAHAFSLAENEAVPSNLRRGALSVLLRHVDRRDTGAATRVAALSARLDPQHTITEATPFTGGAIANAAEVVRDMGPGFRRCYNAALQADPKTSGSVRLTGWVGANGEVVGVEPGSVQGLGPELVACAASVLSKARFSPPEGGHATIVIPLKLMPPPEPPAPASKP
ncbi:Hypothetical protein A7982_00881 [Minicystis rosea]|nr:Hypothetical protein A7982_00881 [Minicystis rosea]